MSTRLINDFVDKFDNLERRIDPQHMSLEAVNQLTQEARQLLSEINHAIGLANQSKHAIYANYDAKALGCIATLANLADALKQTPKLS